MSEHEGHRKRLRERFLNAGLDALAEHEVLELLLTYALPRRDTKPVAKALIARFGDLRGVLQAAPAELTEVEGISENAAVFLCMLNPVQRLCQKQALAGGRTLNTVSQVKSYCQSLFSSDTEEKLYLICLDPRLKVKACTLIATGTVNGIMMSPRQIAEEAVRQRATGVILTHNHPSGNPVPSGEDIQFTCLVRQALNALEIRLYDHIVVGDTCESVRDYENGDDAV